MDMYPTVLKNQIDDLNKNLKDLNNSINQSSNTSDNLQKKLKFWTIVMAIATGVQALAILVQIFLRAGQ